MKTRVMIADDHAVLRAGLKVLLNAQSDIEVVAEAANGIETVTKVRETRPDVLLLDLAMPERSGMSVLPGIKEACPNTHVLVLTMYDDPAYLRSVLAAGGAGYVVKTAADTELVSAIRAVAQGRTFVDLSLNRQAAQEIVDHKTTMNGTSRESSFLLLSEREREVLTLVAQGHTNQEVADRLKLSVKSVETYRARLMEKLGLKRRADLVRYALECDLLTLNKPSEQL